MIMILFLVRPDGALTARAMEPAQHGSLSSHNKKVGRYPLSSWSWRLSLALRAS